MTVCIAFASKSLGRIVAVSDMKLSHYASSFDGAMLKWRPLSANFRWNCLFAFSDISRFESVYQRVIELLVATELPNGSTFADVETAIAGAYEAEREHMVNELLSPLTMDLPTFETYGRERLGDSYFGQLLEKIREVNPQVELLVFGFDERDQPRIFQTSPWGDIVRCDQLGFGAIGSGAPIAYASLHSNTDFLRHSDLGLVTYRLCEAKFAAESAEGVGPTTAAASFGPEGVATVLSPGAVTTARALWERRRKAKIPERVLHVLRTGINMSFAIPFDEHATGTLAAAMYSCSDVADMYKRTLKGLLRMRAQRLLTDAQWIRNIQLQTKVREVQLKVVDGLSSWHSSGTKPPGFADAFRILVLTIGQLKQIQNENGAAEHDA